VTVPAALGYTLQVRKSVRGWVWTVRLGGQHAYGKVQASGEADTPAKALEDAAEALRGVPA
jgi:hypothetical protein